MKKSSSSSQGLKSNKLVNKGQRLGTTTKGVNPRSVSQVGSAMGNHISEKGRTVNKAQEPLYARPAPTNAGQRLGNDVAQATKPGPGGSRIVHPTGSQRCDYD